MIKICALASGSNGNCYYIGNEKDAVLIDVGISRRQVVDRMNKVGLDINKVRAIFITHEHSDHSRGVKVLSDKFQIPVYVTTITFNNSREANRPCKYIPLELGSWIGVGSIKVKGFFKHHDAVDPCSFIVEADGVVVGVMTDIGFACESVTTHFNMCDAVYLEANYDEQMLATGPYPAYLKHRVASKRGHLSNLQALELVENFGSDKLKHLFLSHISQDNNHPTVALNTFDKVKDNFQIHLTNRHAPTKVFEMN